MRLELVEIWFLEGASNRMPKLETRAGTIKYIYIYTYICIYVEKPKHICMYIQRTIYNVFTDYIQSEANRP